MQVNLLKRAALITVIFFPCFFSSCDTGTYYERYFKFNHEEFDLMRAKWEETKPAKYRFTLRNSVFGTPPEVTVLNGKRIEPDPVPTDALFLKDADTVDGIYDFVENRIAEDTALYDSQDIMTVNVRITYDEARYYPRNVSYSAYRKPSEENNDAGSFTYVISDFAILEQ